MVWPEIPSMKIYGSEYIIATLCERMTGEAGLNLDRTAVHVIKLIKYLQNCGKYRYGDSL